eukprot:7093296-Ditylum_brightwellii.AAC.1
MGLFSGYGYSCDIVKVKELVWWDGILLPMLQGRGIVQVDNMNSITESVSLDQCVDEILWPHLGFGSEVLHRLVGKPSINKGGQTVMCFDTGLGYRYPQAYHHRHSLQPSDPPLTTHREMKIKGMMDQIQPMCFGEGCTRNIGTK